ncbi:HEAT repeat domain-containing protein [Haloarchaeobius sp. HME9146]|uniref:HEAT repeat domain-containing protein n=1 Tax=Haloarchaeobius sp. HME9146 TaxID=2978732 RepID=UPI0021BF98BD|nr:HEAT repeat domain-containing protein [Haloarchaeobius sp. HME9146]MCT9094834.1 HEAT repeat domain-containing protein [Haloarchaeobius sp. HME9146]
MYVLAFDRDWTVDVNPHPHEEAVPLEWVRYWAHETDHEVWAIGNQDLVAEADIPGTVESIRRRDGDISALGEQDERGRYEWWPVRERRLEILAGLFPDAEGYVVVDDLELSHVDGWDHYHSWEFMPAIRAGELPLDTPDDADSQPESLLSEAQDDPTTVSLSAARRALDAARESGDRDRMVEALKLALWLVENRGDAVEPLVEPTLDLLARERFPSGRAVLHAVATQAADDPDPLIPHVSDLASLVASRPVYREQGSRTLMEVAAADPAAVVDAVPALATVAEAEGGGTRRFAVYALTRATAAEPEAATPAVGSLVDALLAENETVRTNAATALGRIASVDPDAVAGHADSLGTALNDTNPDVRANVCVLIGKAGGPVELQRLRELASNDPDETVREQATWAIDRLS